MVSNIRAKKKNKLIIIIIITISSNEISKISSCLSKLFSDDQFIKDIIGNSLLKILVKLVSHSLP